MNGTIKALIAEYVLRRHPLAQGIQLQELRELDYRVQRLFQSRDTLLESSPGALGRVRAAAAQCAQNVAHDAHPFIGEDHLFMVRGLTAHLGLAMLELSNGFWRNSDLLLDACVEEKGRMVLTRGAQRITVTRIALAVGCLAADIWQAAISGSNEPLKMIVDTRATWPDGHTRWVRSRMPFPVGSEVGDTIPTCRVSE